MVDELTKMVQYLSMLKWLKRYWRKLMNNDLSIINEK